METVENSLALIKNVSSHPSLCPALREQVLHTVVGFTDPATNPTHIPLSAVVIIEHIHPDNILHTYFYSQSFFEEIESFVASSVFSEERGDFAFYYNPDNTGNSEGSCVLLMCMNVLARAPHYMCSLMGVVQREQSQLELFITKGDEYDKRETIKLLETLSTHTCTACVGGQFALGLLLKLGLTKEPTSPPSGGQKTKLPPLAATPSKRPRLDAAVKSCELPQPPLSSGECVYFRECENFIQSLEVPGKNCRHYNVTCCTGIEL